MSGEVKDTWGFIERVLRAIPMMDIPVHDQNLLERKILNGISGSDGHIVEEAKTHCPVSFRMVTRRSHESKSIIQFSLHDRLDQLQKTSSGHQSGLIGFGTGGGISIESEVRFARCGSDQSNVGRRVDDFKCLLRS